MKMGRTMCIAVAGLLLLAFIPQSEQAQGLCPLTKKPPMTPATLPRCVRYQSSSCCDACLDWSTAATVVSVNGTYVANSLFPPGFSFPGIDKFKQSTVSGSMLLLHVMSVGLEYRDLYHHTSLTICPLTCFERVNCQGACPRQRNQF